MTVTLQLPPLLKKCGPMILTPHRTYHRFPPSVGPAHHTCERLDNRSASILVGLVKYRKCSNRCERCQMDAFGSSSISCSPAAIVSSVGTGRSLWACALSTVVSVVRNRSTVYCRNALCVPQTWFRSTSDLYEMASQVTKYRLGSFLIKNTCMKMFALKMSNTSLQAIEKWKNIQ